jgi:hypothetical protein
MNRKTRLMLAAIVTLILAITATTVWAGSNNKKEGSLGQKIHDAHGTCNGSAVNMGDATFVITVAEKVICSFEVIRTKNPNEAMGGAPEGKKFLSDGFIVQGPDKVGMLQICFAYPPQVREKNAQIFALFGSEKTTLPAVISGTPAQLCAATPNLSGTFAMIGDDKNK